MVQAAKRDVISAPFSWSSPPEDASPSTFAPASLTVSFLGVALAWLARALFRRPREGTRPVCVAFGRLDWTGRRGADGRTPAAECWLEILTTDAAKAVGHQPDLPVKATLTSQTTIDDS